ncbi:MAG: hypothetical protein WEE89_01970 [Gemmatimonadota bacterium]
MVHYAQSAAPAVGSANLEPVLSNMELRALNVAFPDERARIFNLAGDLCFDAGARERALIYYGRAIDVLVAADQIDGAVGVCRKIVRLTPEVVRARCTLAWMALGQGVIQEARQRIADYARAAASAGQEQAASRHLRRMTDIAANQEILESLAEALLEIGDDVGADRAFGAAAGHVDSNSPTFDSQARWETVVRILAGNDAVQFEAAPSVGAVPAPVSPADTKRVQRVERRRRYH